MTPCNQLLKAMYDAIDGPDGSGGGALTLIRVTWPFWRSVMADRDSRRHCVDPWAKTFSGVSVKIVEGKDIVVAGSEERRQFVVEHDRRYVLCKEIIPLGSEGEWAINTAVEEPCECARHKGALVLVPFRSDGPRHPPEGRT